MAYLVYVKIPDGGDRGCINKMDEQRLGNNLLPF